ncbi:hypothetical protein RB2150_00577 [Rhodobacterales bacterium HTCC2150]|nr:hypothetical protein RB2150_00577 [Rhodobacterales bacterium HTCC2150] [Rhodobacteraceae bacterium HTCC2150]
MRVLSKELPQEEVAEMAPEPANLRFLRILVTILTATMILGLLTIVALFVIRFSADPAARVQLPENITLPAGVQAQAVTYGDDWYGVVTSAQEFLIFNQSDNSLRQKIMIKSE